ncbi:hypothetical protein [Nocardia jiangxiensis]|uniref:hypothetical protein n=1 Tax=Nocardia jiangxiensis TaxID=282685 RepID=UPI0003177D30|nr:hypothetical protein [Nocardia jiangxiensis]
MSAHTDELQRQVDRLSAHGKTVWEELNVAYTMDTAAQTLALQVCRLVDRLDRLEAALKSNKTWIRIAEESMIGPDAAKITVTCDAALSEARQQAVALTQILHKLGVGKLDNAAPRESSFDDVMRRIQEL